MVAVRNVLAPRAATEYAESGLDGLQRVVRQSTIGLSLGMGLFATFLLFGGDSLLRLCFGVDYGGHQLVIVLLAISEWAFASMLGAASGLTVLERTNLIFRSDLIGILVTVTMAIPLISNFGLTGAAVAQLSGRVIGSVIVIACYRSVIRRLRAGKPPEPTESPPIDLADSPAVGHLELNPDI